MVERKCSTFENDIACSLVVPTRAAGFNHSENDVLTNQPSPSARLGKMSIRVDTLTFGLCGADPFYTASAARLRKSLIIFAEFCCILRICVDSTFPGFVPHWKQIISYSLIQQFFDLFLGSAKRWQMVNICIYISQLKVHTTNDEERPCRKLKQNFLRK